MLDSIMMILSWPYNGEHKSPWSYHVIAWSSCLTMAVKPSDPELTERFVYWLSGLFCAHLTQGYFASLKFAKEARWKNFDNLYFPKKNVFHILEKNQKMPFYLHSTLNLVHFDSKIFRKQNRPILPKSCNWQVYLKNAGCKKIFFLQ